MTYITHAEFVSEGDVIVIAGQKFQVTGVKNRAYRICMNLSNGKTLNLRSTAAVEVVR